jgi:hypothetical protein
LFTAEAQRAQRYYFFDLPLRGRQIKILTPLRAKKVIPTYNEHNHFPEGNVVFCFLASQQKAKRKNNSANFAPLR